MKTKLLRKFRKFAQQNVYIKSSLTYQNMYALLDEYMHIHDTYIVNDKKDLQELYEVLRNARRVCIMNLISQYKSCEWDKFCRKEIRKINKQNI